MTSCARSADTVGSRHCPRIVSGTHGRSGWRRFSPTRQTVWISSSTWVAGPTRSLHDDISRMQSPGKPENRCGSTTTNSTQRIPEGDHLMSMIADASFEDIPPIPSRVRTFDGQMIETGSSLWRMRACCEGGGDSITINWERMAAAHGGCGFSARAAHFVRLYLTDRPSRFPGWAQTFHSGYCTASGNRTSRHRRNRYLWP